MTKTYEPRWGYNACGTANMFPFNADFLAQGTEIKKASKEAVTDGAFEKTLTSIISKLPFWVDRPDMIQKIKTARKYSHQEIFEQKLTITIKELEDKKFRLLEEVLKSQLSIDSREKLNEFANTFLMMMGTVDKPVTLNQSKKACKLLVDDLRNTIDKLKDFDIR
jgi:hypothetical protein